MKIDFSKIKLMSIDGQPVAAEIHKDLANAMYANVKDLGLIEKAREIYQGKEVDLSDTEIVSVKQVIDIAPNGQNLFTAFARKGMHDFLDEAKKVK